MFPRDPQLPMRTKCGGKPAVFERPSDKPVAAVLDDVQDERRDETSLELCASVDGISGLVRSLGGQKGDYSTGEVVYRNRVIDR